MSARTALRHGLVAAEARVLAALPVRWRRQWWYLRVQHRWSTFAQPELFTEKVNWRMLHDRRECLAWTCDKVRMKEQAAASGADVVVPVTWWTGTDVRELAGVALPDRWVLKPAHRCGLVHFGHAGTDLEALARATRGWLDAREADHLGEWAYGLAEPRFLVEEFVGEGETSPADVKLLCFDGEPRALSVDLDRFGDHRRAFYTPDWEKIDVEAGAADPGPLPRPALLPQMLEAARVLSAGFDFMRIDLYVDGDRLVFGEYTPYPGGGLIRFRPRSVDAAWGALWRLPDLDAAGRARDYCGTCATTRWEARPASRNSRLRCGTTRVAVAEDSPVPGQRS